MSDQEITAATPRVVLATIDPPKAKSTKAATKDGQETREKLTTVAPQAAPSEETKSKFTNLWTSTSEGISNWYDRSEQLPGERLGNFLVDCSHQTYDSAHNMCSSCSTQCSTQASRTSRAASDQTKAVYSNLKSTAANTSQKATDSAKIVLSAISKKTGACTAETYSCTQKTCVTTKQTTKKVNKFVRSEFAEPPGTSRKEHVRNVWVDSRQPLASQRLKTRLLCFPCQCGSACATAFYHIDFDACMTILFCCPCRTFCGLFPTVSEKGKAVTTDDRESECEQANDYNAIDQFSEPDEIPYNHSLGYAPLANAHEQGEERTYNDRPLFDDEPVFDEDDEVVTYDRVFELERKKRQLFNNAENKGTD